jgi:hypothetical protein
VKYLGQDWVVTDAEDPGSVSATPVRSPYRDWRNWRLAEEQDL